MRNSYKKKLPTNLKSTLLEPEMVVNEPKRVDGTEVV
jgi:hypothetical protein